MDTQSLVNRNIKHLLKPKTAKEHNMECPNCSSEMTPDCYLEIETGNGVIYWVCYTCGYTCNND